MGTVLVSYIGHISTARFHPKHKDVTVDTGEGSMDGDRRVLARKITWTAF